MSVDTVHMGRRVGVNVDGRPAGYAVKLPRGRGWTTFANIAAPPFDCHAGVYPTEEAAVDAIVAVAKQERAAR